jgi:hypothetical protein
MAFPTFVYVENVQGPLLLESYVAGVVQAEIGFAALAARRAQAVAARTYVLRAIRDNPRRGTAEKPLVNSQHFQVYKPNPTERTLQATAETAGIVCRHAGELMVCNYVAGAYWTTDGRRGEDPTKTERYVTYNEGKTGSAVKPTSLSNMSRPDNRGCMSQNGADWLAHNGRDYPAILRYFYGADIEIGPLLASVPIQPSPPPPPSPPPTSTAPPMLVLAALAALAVEG